MGLYIKGVKMPDYCCECPCYDGEYECCNVIGRCCGDERPDWCPLLEVKEPHGRLIDADEMVSLWKGCTFEGSITCLLDPRPTVLEAEGD